MCICEIVNTEFDGNLTSCQDSLILPDVETYAKTVVKYTHEKSAEDPRAEALSPQPQAATIIGLYGRMQPTEGYRQMTKLCIPSHRPHQYRALKIIHVCCMC